jgi:hypothetical protein
MTDETTTVVTEEVATTTDTPTDAPVVETTEAEGIATPDVAVEAEVKE